MLRQLTLIAFAFLYIISPAAAQTAFPKCSGTGAGSVYFVDATTGQIFEMDPSTGNSTTIPLSVPLGSFGLAIGAAPTTGLPSPTFYTTFKIGLFTYIHYYNGSAWINTGRIMPYSNITGGGNYLYGYDCVSGAVYQASVTGTANSTQLVIVGGGGNCGSCDIAADCSGNFYILNQTSSTLKKYSSTGALIQTYTITGTPQCGGSGLAVNGTEVYYDGSDGNLYKGVISGTSITFSAVTTNTPFLTVPSDDFASCGYATIGNGIGTLDTTKICGNATNFQLKATGPGPYNWTVISGPATITGTGSTVSVASTATTVITHLDADCSGANTVSDTDVIFISKATVDAGPDHILTGCRGQFADTLHGSISDTSAGVLYSPEWTPLTDIVANPTSYNPIIQPTGTKYFVLTVKTITGCEFKDSVKVTLADSTPKADFQWILKLGCEEDTVQFVNTSTGLIDTARWDFGDTTGTPWLPSGALLPFYIVEAISPRHIYQNQAIHSVWLYVSNKYCTDSIRKNVDHLHTLRASFDVDDDSVCAKTTIKFNNTSAFKRINNKNPIYRWDFGDGTTSNQASLSHTYTKPGTYLVRMVIEDGLPCFDTAYHTIRIDSVPYVNVVTTDTSICEGQSLTINSNYLTVGNTGFTLDLGDGTVFQNATPVTYSYQNPGQYVVTLTAHYRICPDTFVKKTIDVRPFPGINIGQDTVLCPNGSPIVLTDRINLGNAKAKYLWSTGETTSSILAKNIGVYWARVDVGGCTGTDSLTVNKDCYIDIPNSFTPNGDGTNDYFLPRQFLSRSLNSFKMTVFNRWGQVIFESNSNNGRGWDGKYNDKDQPQGVYIYVIDATFDNGVKEHYTGNVTLLR